MRRFLIVTFALLGLALVSVTVWAVRAAPTLRGRVVDALNARFESQLALGSLDPSMFPTPRARGTALTFRHRGRTDVPPLITIESFDTSAGLAGLIQTPVRLKTVRIKGMAVRIPPGGIRVENGDQDLPHVAHAERPSPILINRIESQSARVEIQSRRPDRLPRVWDVQNLVMIDFGSSAGSRFDAGLINPVPRGVIDTQGMFGPWHSDEPGLSPVSGNYIFQNADMDAIKGLGGTLSSAGSYHGVLERIEVDGTTETPDFSLDLAGQKVPLNTRFKAIVDGTNGDTILERVDARLNNSAITARGSVIRTQEAKGRHVELDVRLDGARLEDLMQLAVKASKPPLVGQVDLTTRMVLPAGSEDVVDRLQLDGTFQLAQARFSNINVQRRITTLSRRGRGEENDEGADHERVVSNLRGRFKLARAALTFSELTFAVPGSIVQLHGSYDLHTQEMNFSGELLTDATLSDMTSGFKSLLARLAQPLFRRKGGGTRLPIRISGTRAKPQFGLDFGRVLHRD